MATFTASDLVFNFRGQSSDWGTKFYPDSGCNLLNVSFYYINAKNKFLQFAGGGSVTDCVVDHCQSLKQFVNLVGATYNGNKKPMTLTNCNFTNCNQTYGLNPDNPNYDDYYDGNGQFGAVLGAALNNCNFINITSGHHGGALCIADESEWGPSDVTSTLYNCKFINITSRWFAIYIHALKRMMENNPTLSDEAIRQKYQSSVNIPTVSQKVIAAVRAELVSTSN